MHRIRSFLQFVLSKGTTPQLDSGTRLAVQVSNLYALWGACTMTIMMVYLAYFIPRHPLVYILAIMSMLAILSYVLISKRCYDCGRYLFQTIGVLTIFFGVDALGEAYEKYYLVNISIPFIIFSPQEKMKSIFFGGLGAIIYLFQYKLGSGLVFPMVIDIPGKELMAILGSVLFLLLMFIFFRYEMQKASEDIATQQADLIHKVNLTTIGKLTANMAHEINSPLQMMVLYIDLLEKTFTSENLDLENARNHLDGINRTTQKINSIVKGLRQLARDGSGDSIQVVYVDKVIDEVVNVSRDKIDKLGIQLSISNPSAFEVYAQPVYLAQALLNILSNSIDALEVLEKKWIEIDVIDKSDFVQISITDSGNGIPLENRAKIMQPFFTTKSPSKGTGLGLSLSKTMIEKNGGRLYYDDSCSNTKFVVECLKAN